LAENAVAAPHDHAHQFDDREQQAEAVSLGMWAFLVQEILFFGGLFMSYTVYRSYYPQAFVEGSHHLNVLLGGFNTVVLIASSLTMAMAVHSSQTSKRAIWFFPPCYACTWISVPRY
jgi:cytochrome c oxidase subunit 3